MSIGSEPMAKWGPPTDKPHGLWEYVGGEWKETPRLGAFATLVAFRLAKRLKLFAEEPGLGLCVKEALFRLAPEGSARHPDLAFVADKCWPFIQILPRNAPAIEMVPNLAVEVNRPTTLADEIIDKTHDYFSAGVQLIWVIYPRQRIVHVHENPELIRVLREKQELDGGVVPPGFRMPVASLFDVSVKPA